jgi:hypothetical protein
MFGSMPVPDAGETDATNDMNFMEFLAGLDECDPPSTGSTAIPLEYCSSPPSEQLAAPTNCTQSPLTSYPIYVPATAGTEPPTRRTASRRATTAAERLERLRAKNRRGQAKYREKCKVRSVATANPALQQHRCVAHCALHHLSPHQAQGAPRPQPRSAACRKRYRSWMGSCRRRGRS